LSAAFGRLLDALAVAAALILLAMVALVTADILLRNIASIGISWANEVTEYALYATTLLVAPWLLRRGQHVRIDLILTMVPARIAWGMEVATDILGFATCMVMVRYGWVMTVDSARLGAITIKNLVFPEWWLLAPLPATFALLGIEFIFRFARLMQGSQTGSLDATSVR
jgi:TRAP-type C4-dicarboxylate transport system permease small subunit